MNEDISKILNKANKEVFKKGVEKLAKKDIEDIYLLIKDLQFDIQNLYYDERLQLTRNQWATISRLFSTIKELT